MCLISMGYTAKSFVIFRFVCIVLYLFYIELMSIGMCFSLSVDSALFWDSISQFLAVGQDFSSFPQIIQATWHFCPWGEEEEQVRDRTVFPCSCSNRPKYLSNITWAFKWCFNNKRTLNLPVTYFRNDKIPQHTEWKYEHVSPKTVSDTSALMGNRAVLV